MTRRVDGAECGWLLEHVGLRLHELVVDRLKVQPADVFAVDATGIAPKLVSPERARYSREHVGSEYIGWLHFQTIYDQLVKTQPDMFE